MSVVVELPGWRVAAVVAAALAAALLPGGPPGIGVPLVAAAVAVAVALGIGWARERAALGAAAVALTAVAALRDAAWVVAIDLVAAWILAAVAVAGRRVLAPLAPLVRLVDARALAPPVPRGYAPVLRGAVLGGLLVLPFGALFWSADAAFAALGRALPLPPADALAGRVLTFAGTLSVAAGLVLAAGRPLVAPVGLPRRRLVLPEWAIPLGLLDALFLAFVVVQVTVLFGGHDYVLRTSGLTYAEYARAGFWQLLAASALTVAVAACAPRLADAPRRWERRLLRALVAVLCALALVVVAAALHRLRLYEDAYGLTRLRLAAEGAAVWFGGVFALVLAAQLHWRARATLGGAVVAGTAAFLLAASLADPDARIAERNVERWHATGRLDVAYLGTLSADAVPAIATLPRPLRERALAPIAVRLARDDPWGSANLARARARRLLDDLAAES